MWRCLASAAVMVSGLMLVSCGGGSGPSSTSYAKSACRDLRAAGVSIPDNQLSTQSENELQAGVSYSEKAGGALGNDARHLVAMYANGKGKNAAFYFALAKVLEDCRIPVYATLNTGTP